MTRRSRLSSLVLLALAVSAAAPPIAAQPLPRQIHRWTDESGRTHMTDDPNLVPEHYRPAPPPPDPRMAARAAVDALRSLAALVSEDPPHDDYARTLTEARRTVDQALGVLERGALRTALTDALRCYREAGELWDNQLHVRRSMDLPLNMAPIRRAWECGAQKTAEAERRLAASRP
jgi:hypothetical protein